MKQEEIKFRAWDKEKKQMIPVDMIYFHGWADEISRESGIKGDSRRVGYKTKTGYKVVYSFELMQYTGLKDKNGKEIYEGDILKNKYGVVTEIRWDNGSKDLRSGVGGFSISAHSLFLVNHDTDIPPMGFLHDSYEVIGNIYENPELLNK